MHFNKTCQYIIQLSINGIFYFLFLCEMFYTYSKCLLTFSKPLSTSNFTTSSFTASGCKNNAFLIATLEMPRMHKLAIKIAFSRTTYATHTTHLSINMFHVHADE